MSHLRDAVSRVRQQGVPGKPPATGDAVADLVNSVVEETVRLSLERLQNDARAERVWERISSAAFKHIIRQGPRLVATHGVNESIGPDEAALAFVLRVVLTRAHTSYEAEWAKRYAPAMREVRESQKRQRDDFARAVQATKTDRELYILLTTAAWAMLFAAGDEGFAEPSPDKVPPGWVPRSDKNGSRERTIFIGEISRVVRELSGSPLDAEVATLAEVIFDEVITAEAVRAIRKSYAGDISDQINGSFGAAVVRDYLGITNEIRGYLGIDNETGELDSENQD
jgi:hypothetical protein